MIQQEQVTVRTVTRRGAPNEKHGYRDATPEERGDHRKKLDKEFVRSIFTRDRPIPEIVQDLHQELQFWETLHQNDGLLPDTINAVYRGVLDNPTDKRNLRAQRRVVVKHMCNARNGTGLRGGGDDDGSISSSGDDTSSSSDFLDDDDDDIDGACVLAGDDSATKTTLKEDAETVFTLLTTEMWGVDLNDPDWEEESKATHNSFLARIQSCKGISEINDMYLDKEYQMALERIARAQQHLRSVDNLWEWARSWAVALARMDHNSPEYHHAFALNQDRKACLELLKVLHDLCFKSGVITVNDIVQFDDKHRVKRILTLCLVMDKAQCLFKMKRDGPFPVGMHWYSQQHLDNGLVDASFEEWNTPTLSRKYVDLYQMDELNLVGDPLLDVMFQPHARFDFT